MLVERLRPDLRARFFGGFAQVSVAGRSVAVLCPWTYMNDSGRSVAAAMQALELAHEQVLVVHDELDLPFGTVRLKLGGGTGGHRGLKSIVRETGGADFGRLRIGVGRPEVGSIVEWVLGDFAQSDGQPLDDVLKDATRALNAAVAGGIRLAMNTVNAREPNPRND